MQWSLPGQCKHSAEWGKLGQGCGNSVWKWEQERPMFSLTSAVQISAQKKLCACVYEWVCVHVRGQRSQLWEEEVQTQHSQKWPLQSRIMWKSHHTETFPLWSKLGPKAWHKIHLELKGTKVKGGPLKSVLWRITQCLHFSSLIHQSSIHDAFERGLARTEVLVLFSLPISHFTH